MNRRDAVSALVAFATLPLIAMAQQFPSKPMRIVVPFPPGGGVDSLARVIVPPLSNGLGQPIAILSRIILTLMVPSAFPADNLRELIGYARANPGKVKVGAGNSVSVLVTAQLSKLVGIEVVTVSCKGDARAATDLVAERVQAAFIASAPLVGHIKNGRIRVLATLSG